MQSYRVSNAYGWLEVEETDFEDDRNIEASSNVIEKTDLSEDQLKAFDAVTAWLKRGYNPSKPVLTLGGYAGTGKTTLVSLIAKHNRRNIAFCAYTGKAANVLAQKLNALGVNPSYCGTIHRLIYQPIVDDKTGAVTGWEKVESLPYSLIVVDEASMVDEKMLADLKSYEVPILAVGDHGQLPPVQGMFNLMSSPEVRLEHIHRQAANNPIIQLSAAIREHGLNAIPYSSVGPVTQVGESFKDLFKDHEKAKSTAILCFTNKRRNSLNSSMRSLLFSGSPPGVLQVDDSVVCLKNTRFGEASYVFNGMRGRVTKVLSDTSVSVNEDDDGKFSLAASSQVRARVAFPDDRLVLQARINARQFGMEKTISKFDDAGPSISNWGQVGMLFDYGYCLTAHKAQGSEFTDAAVVLENMSYLEADYQRRWAYTAVTRASKRLYLVR